MVRADHGLHSCGRTEGALPVSPQPGSLLSKRCEEIKPQACPRGGGGRHCHWGFRLMCSRGRMERNELIFRLTSPRNPTKSFATYSKSGSGSPFVNANILSAQCTLLCCMAYLSYYSPPRHFFLSKHLHRETKADPHITELAAVGTQLRCRPPLAGASDSL